MAIYLYIYEGSPLTWVDRTDYLKINTGHISRDVNGKAEFSAMLEELGRGYRPVWGNRIRISDGGSPETRWFEGHIFSIVERHHPPGSRLQYEIRCVDYNHIAARRIMSGCFENMTLHNIVARIVEVGLSDEGVTTVSVADPGLTIAEKLIFNYETVKAVLDRLAAITGYVWWIDCDKDLHFDVRATEPAPWGLTDTSGDWRDMEVERSAEEHRNRQHERSELTVASTAGTETGEFPWTPTAGATWIPTRAVTAEVLAITVNDVARTFLRVEESESDPGAGADFFYRPNWCGAKCLDIGAFAGGEVCYVNYMPGYSAWPSSTELGSQGSGPQVATVDDTTEQVARAAIEGGSGIWEAVEEQRNLTTVSALQAVGEGRLRQFSGDIVKVRFNTFKNGLEPGQKIHIENTPHDLDLDFLIERIDYDWQATVPNRFLYTVQCTTGEP